MSTSETEKINTLRNFLLGKLPAPERDGLEQSLLADGELYELLLATEEELIDECVQGALSEEEAASLLQYLGRLPDGRRRVDFASRLDDYLQSSGLPNGASPGEGVTGRPRRRTWFPREFSIAAAVLFLAAGGLVSVWVISDLRGRVAELRSELGRSRAEESELQAQIGESRARNEELNDRLEELRVPPGGGPQPSSETSPGTPGEPYPSILLSPGTLRGAGERATLVLPGEATVVELKLDLGFDDYSRYRAVVHDSESRELFAVSQLEANVSTDRILVPVEIPTSNLTAGDYYVSLEGLTQSGGSEPVATYDFRVAVK